MVQLKRKLRGLQIFAKNMPEWPANDAIQKDGDLIIVKMGEIK